MKEALKAGLLRSVQWYFITIGIIATILLVLVFISQLTGPSSIETAQKKNTCNAIREEACVYMTGCAGLPNKEMCTMGMRASPFCTEVDNVEQLQLTTCLQDMKKITCEDSIPASCEGL